ncbi:MAG TPA: AI-2E family transporter [Polyangiales bacterium]|nr:AI-2E family transporter [Polyangiales bacterium]
MPERPSQDPDVSGVVPHPIDRRTQTQRVMTVAGLVVILAGLKYSEPFIVPVVMGVMVAAVSSPLVTWLVRKGAPPVLGAAAVLVIDIAVLGGIGRLLLLAASDLQDGLPTYITKLSQFSHAVEQYLNSRGLHDVSGVASIHSEQVGSFIQGMVGNFATLASHVAVVIFVVFFALCEISGMGEKLRKLTSDAEVQFEQLDRIVRQVQLYLVVKFWTSLLAGVCAYVVLKAVGVDLALLLALTLFLLHFIPNIGTAIATAPAVLFALADKGPAAALTVGVAYLSINTLIGNLIEPRMLGSRLGVSPFMVLLGMLFWGFMWGPVGALLSVPILVATKIAVENIPELAWLSVLAGGTPSTVATPARESSTHGPLRATLGLGLRAVDKRTTRETKPGFRLRDLPPR